MKVVFFTNYINHHQVHLADEFYKLTNQQYYLIENMPMPEFRQKLGYADYNRPYVIQAWKDKRQCELAMKIGMAADIGITGSAPWNYAILRLRKGKITFNYEERVLKRGLINAFSPEVFKSMMIAWALQKNHYTLCASAYNANDMKTLHAFNNKCYKWAYFTEVPSLNIDQVIQSREKELLKIIWVARFIPWKHAELALQLAERLRNDGINFILTMVGNGPELKKCKLVASKKGLTGFVEFKGNISSNEVMPLMKEHHIHIFTSDKNEGWGAVLNESMSSGCCPVASNMIGAAPFLIDEGKNGFMFESENVESLYERVSFLSSHRNIMNQMGKEAYMTMISHWTPKRGAESFMDICEDLLRGVQAFKENGPCSKAEPYKWVHRNAENLVM